MTEPQTMNQAASFPLTGFVRLPAILNILPIGKSTWWQGVKDGRYPASVKLSTRITAWRVEDIRNLIESLAQKGAYA